MSESLGKFSALSFLGMKWNCPHKKEGFFDPSSQIPSPPFLDPEDLFAKIYLAWNEKGLFIGCQAKTLSIITNQTEFRKADSLEIFLDTRAGKTSGYLTKYDHHFLFFPQAIDGFFGKEITRFSADEIHPLANKEDLYVSSHLSPSGYKLEIFLPASSLYGYDPSSYDRMGFAYRINRPQKSFQSFGGSEDLAKIEKNPTFFCEVFLRK